MKLSNKNVLLITLVAFLTLLFISKSMTNTQAYNVNGDIILDLEVNGVSLDEAVSGEGKFPISKETNYSINFKGDINIINGLTIHFLEFVIKEAGFGIHEPIRIEELNEQHFNAGSTIHLEYDYPIPEELHAIIDNIKGTHELEVKLSYTLDGEAVPKEFVEETEIYIESEGLVDTVTSASGAATTAISAGAAVATVGTASTVVSTFSYMTGKFFDDLKNLWKGVKTTKEVSKAIKKGVPLRAKVKGNEILQAFMDKVNVPPVAQDGGEIEGESEKVSLSAEDLAKKEALLKDLLKETWDMKKCPACGAKWSKKKGSCKNKECNIDLDTALTTWVENIWPFLLVLSNLTLIKKKRLKKLRKKVKVNNQKLSKKTVRQLAAVLVQGQLIDVDWKSVVPVGKLIRSGLFIGASIFLWLFLYGILRISPQNLILSLTVSIMVPLIIGLILRNRINKKQKQFTASIKELSESETEIAIS
ncbi:MAG: hypothetical protein ACTSU4_01620 [Promethearchaeota archaeon]